MEHLAIFQKYFPPTTVEYCHSLWHQHRFKFIISPKRSTKLGDYRYEAAKGHHIVTVNGNLNPMSFLTTYIHEVAHLTTFKRFGTKVLPHGPEWKQEFRVLFAPLLHEAILAKEAIQKLKAYLKNPRASSCSEHGLFDAHANEVLNEGEMMLKDLPIGSQFMLKKRHFTKLEHRRTRILCLDTANGKRYLVPQKAIVKLLQNVS